MDDFGWGPTLAHLVAAGHVAADDALGGRVVVRSDSRSNPVATVLVDDVATFVVKAPRISVDDVDPLTAERDAYRWLALHSTLRARAPTMVAAPGDVLVLDFVGDHHVLEPGDTVGGAGLARTLAVLHSAPTDGALLRPRRPWVLDLVDARLPDLFAPDPELVALAETIAGAGELTEVLTELAARWRPLAPIHGDVKFDNVLVPTDPQADVRLLDWELAGLGLPAWDLAGILDGHVVPALHAMAPADALDHLETTEPILRAHRDAVEAALVVDDDELHLATVARLVQSSMQLAAMRHLDPDCETLGARVLLTARFQARRTPTAA